MREGETVCQGREEAVHQGKRHLSRDVHQGRRPCIEGGKRPFVEGGWRLFIEGGDCPLRKGGALSIGESLFAYVCSLHKQAQLVKLVTHLSQQHSIVITTTSSVSMCVWHQLGPLHRVHQGRRLFVEKGGCSSRGEANHPLREGGGHREEAFVKRHLSREEATCKGWRQACIKGGQRPFVEGGRRLFIEGRGQPCVEGGRLSIRREETDCVLREGGNHL